MSSTTTNTNTTANGAPQAKVVPITKNVAPAADGLGLPDGAGLPAPYLDAYEASLAELGAITEPELIVINVDVTAALTGALASLPGLRAMQPDSKTDVGRHWPEMVDTLQRHAFAAIYAQSRYASAGTEPEPIQQLLTDAEKWRDILYSNAVAIGSLGRVDASQVREMRPPVGYRATAFDLVKLVAFFRDHWTQIGPVTALTEGAITQAENLAARLMDAVAEREREPGRVADAALLRHKAFSLFARTYDEVRRTVTYLRWKERDVDSIIPSLYASRRVKRRDKSADDAATTAEAPPSSDLIAEPSGSAEHAQSTELGHDAGGTAATSGAADATTVKATTEPGTPGSSPFAQA